MKLKEIISLCNSELRQFMDAREAEAVTREICDVVLHYDAVDMVLRADVEIHPVLADKVSGILRRLRQGEPLQYVLGVAHFHGHNFKVTPAVLIPRPETAQLVDIIVDDSDERADLRVLDIGTGSGCIAISLARALRFPQVEAIDISDAALQVASENAAALKVKVDFQQADILQMDDFGARRYDVIVSNPPYVTESEKAAMEQNVKDHEPAEALFVPDDDPLLYYKAIVRYAAETLRSDGRLYFEVNERYAERVAELLRINGFSDVAVIKDSYGKQRFVKALH